MRKAKGGSGSSSTDVKQLRSALLREGIDSYPLAMQAIAEFRHEIFSILGRVAERRAKTISHIVGHTGFKRDSDEVDGFLEGSETYLSVRTKGPSSTFHIYVYWHDGDRHRSPVRICAAIYFETKAMFQKIDKALQDRFGSKFTTDDEGWGCYLEEVINSEHADQLESALGKLCNRWLKMLQTANIRKLIRSKR